ncbi:hypothetical protein V6N11_082782 [Hibiscus sabdariffa]|uniref:RNase H type-1 domain-containing protein n=1 Tax=Hibiscus sabdariffa TaxID=183260 RepID=A0ABR2QJX0_9ROSI
MAFFAITWSIWLRRNDVLFRGKGLDENQLFEIVLLRLWWWSRAKWPQWSMSIEDFMRNPECWGVARVEKRICKKDEWEAPPAGIAKFNTNGAVKGRFGPTGVGGVLRDHSGNVLLKFSNSIGIADPASAELLAIKKALSLFATPGLIGNVNLQVETNCNNVVAWFRQPSTTPNAFKDLVLECLAMLKDLKWELALVDRSKNSIVDRLAKMGIDGNICGRAEWCWEIRLVTNQNDAGKWVFVAKRGNSIEYRVWKQ